MLTGVLCLDSPLKPNEVSGSGAMDLSGSGSFLEPMTTPQEEMMTTATASVPTSPSLPIEPPPISTYIKLTFNNLTLEQFNRIKEDLTGILVELLGLNSDPQLIIDLENSRSSVTVILVYFGVDKSTINSYAAMLLSNDNTQWELLQETYVCILFYYY